MLPFSIYLLVIQSSHIVNITRLCILVYTLHRFGAKLIARANLVTWISYGADKYGVRPMFNMLGKYIGYAG